MLRLRGRHCVWRNASRDLPPNHCSPPCSIGAVHPSPHPLQSALGQLASHTRSQLPLLSPQGLASSALGASRLLLDTAGAAQLRVLHSLIAELAEEAARRLHQLHTQDVGMLLAAMASAAGAGGAGGGRWASGGAGGGAAVLAALCSDLARRAPRMSDRDLSGVMSGGGGGGGWVELWLRWLSGQRPAAVCIYRKSTPHCLQLAFPLTLCDLT